jgi:hypothetical protein
VSDDDPRCGPSSIQKFDGEDLKRQERIREQQMQMKVWTALAKQEALKRREEQLSDKE